MYKFIIITAFLLLNLSVKAYSQALSAQAEISIITCAPGDDLYSTFGHSAIRIKDPSLRIDNVYNYGTFNFETPNFYMKFTKGQLDYMLSVSPYKYFIISYMNENRWIKEQILDLTRTQKNKIFQFLKNNALPENMYYRYDFFYDNCATRVKDVIKDVLNEELILPESITKEKETYRDLLEKYLINKKWERFGINLALGNPADKIVTAEEASFLPDYLKILFDGAVLEKNGVTKPLVKETKMLFETKVKSEKKVSAFNPLNIFSFLLFVVLLFTFFEINKKKYFLILDKTIMFIVGLIGFVILLLWFVTEHGAVINNMNIIWAMPLFLIAAFMLKRKDNMPLVRGFLLVITILMIIGLAVDLAFFNMFDFASAPIITILILRSFLFYKFRK